MTSLKNFFHLSVTGYCHVQATSVDTSWVPIQSITHFPFFIYVKQMHFPIEREISAWSVNLSSQTLIMDIANFESVAIILCKVNTSYLYNPNCRNGYGKSDTYPIGDCWIKDIMVPNWWNMSFGNFLGTCQILYFSSKLCFRLIQDY